MFYKAGLSYAEVKCRHWRGLIMDVNWQFLMFVVQKDMHWTEYEQCHRYGVAVRVKLCLDDICNKKIEKLFYDEAELV